MGGLRQEWHRQAVAAYAVAGTVAVRPRAGTGRVMDAYPRRGRDSGRNHRGIRSAMPVVPGTGAVPVGGGSDDTRAAISVPWGSRATLSYLRRHSEVG